MNSNPRSVTQLLLCGCLLLAVIPGFAGMETYQVQNPHTTTDAPEADTLRATLTNWVAKVLPTDKNAEPGFRWIETTEVADDPTRPPDGSADAQRIVGPGGMFRRFEHAPAPASRNMSSPAMVAPVASTLTLQASTPAGLAVPEHEVTWAVRPLGQGREQRLQGRHQQLALPAGRYEITLRIGAYTESRVMDLKPHGGQAASAFTASIGYLRATSKAPASWEVFALPGKQRVMGSNGGTAISGILPAGDYQVVATIDNARQAQQVQVRAGERSLATLNVPTGKVNLVATLGSVPALRPVSWRVYRLDGGRHQVAAPQRHSATLVVPPGHYEAIASLNGRERKREFTVMDGTRNDIILAMD